ncbi:Cytochrome c551 peroxidase precursor [Sulfitobacter sp. THAF37]|uniref:cytochrome-c peroxidase n=1 Tax=Sulfitobacter sp. THAF37 TaxID=2587855 RepID=UPI0012A88DEF|nr:cytochrome c peroxidase [Sulfitobacter sp. THAF37]QFT57339.1 Cytochrome c551 peroxidase precursor [Sulfitobacter sp. THAF37]
MLRGMIRSFPLRWVLLGALCWPAAAPAQTLPDPVGDADYRPVDLEEARLGQVLFYDPILSGNRSVACATCHHPDFGTGDGVSLALGDGGLGLGPDRVADPDNPPEERIPRNAPGLFNLGAHEFSVMFHDGRLEVDADRPGGLRTPMDADMVGGFASVLSAQTMFPVLSRDEMAGSHRENDVARAVRQGVITGPGGAWDLIARRVAAVPEYAARFRAVYPHVAGPEDIAFTDISNAIAVFMAHEWRSDTAPFDAVLRGEAALEGAAQAGLRLFYGAAGCAGCHSGPFLTDHDFHAMGTPQIGPGKSASFEDHHRDEGRFRVTGDPDDLYAFRTPSLRNVALTAPYGHAGGHRDLAAFVAAHADPAAGMAAYTEDQAVLTVPKAEDFAVMRDPAQVAAILGAVRVPPVRLSPEEVGQIVAFLNTLTDPVAAEGRLGVPETVPSGLPVPR